MLGQFRPSIFKEVDFVHQIDLGDEVQFEITYKGKKYTLREPTVDEMELIKDESLSFSGMLEKLGMPAAVVGGMGISKARALVDGMLEMIGKKK